MLLSSIVKLSTVDKDLSDFKTEIKNEVETYKRCLSKKGARIPIIFEEDADLLTINFKQLIHIINTGQLDAYEASYIADAITLSERFNYLNESDAYFIESIVLNSSS